MKACRICDQAKKDNEFRGKRRVCRECEKRQKREYHWKNREELSAKKKLYRQKYKKELEEAELKYRMSLRLSAMRILANPVLCGKHSEWGCCGNPENMRYLTFDHINDNGNKHRREIKKKIELWIVKNPERAKKELQILCMNAQWIKKNINRDYTKV